VIERAVIRDSAKYRKVYLVKKAAKSWKDFRNHNELRAKGCRNSGRLVTRGKK
jgi:hypothetical protein